MKQDLVPKGVDEVDARLLARTNDPGNEKRMLIQRKWILKLRTDLAEIVEPATAGIVA